ncbi:hypothetical protein E5A73_02460 [Sphingomonas gei]|uniref:Uncharacterized protein n=1 Tax=Sphingomonas gei TaxID=1395960 RepID=A0A4S1XH85_9SPHN|nr:hypothetical protein [Sphingomonas gei]TGX55994.1 hypothetical protein E5A73_02460 [Sphingomonas gei]
MDGALHRPAERLVIAHLQRDIPCRGKALRIGAFAEIVGGLLGHADGTRGAEHIAHRGERGNEVALAGSGPAIVIDARERDGGESEGIGILGIGRSLRRFRHEASPFGGFAVEQG